MYLMWLIFTFVFNNVRYVSSVLLVLGVPDVAHFHFVFNNARYVSSALLVLGVPDVDLVLFSPM